MNCLAAVIVKVNFNGNLKQKFLKDILKTKVLNYERKAIVENPKLKG